MILIIEILQKALMVAAFVTVMMLLVEYVNVQTQGVLLNALAGSRISQYVLAAILGAVPGCLGAFVVVALYAHRRVTLGALVTAMIATSGDEAFVMLALFPATMVCLTAGLMFVGIVTGYVTDRFLPRVRVFVSDDCHFLDTHDEDDCRSFPRGSLRAAWRPPSPQRLALVLGLAGLVVALAAGVIGPSEWGWKRVTFLALMAAGIAISATVPEHFLRQHLWHHVVIRHVPRVLLWTIIALTMMAALTHFVHFEEGVSGTPWGLLAGAAIVGLLPESGPHLIFVTMYADRLIPLSVLAVSAIVQDGHGMLPLLSASKRAFVIVKLINLVVGLAVGGAMMIAGS